MVWDEEQAGSSTGLSEELTYRASDGATVALPAISAGLAWAGLAWAGLPDDLQDEGTTHPIANGAYLSAASMYAHITQAGAGNSEYQYNDALADAALYAVLQAVDQPHDAASENAPDLTMASSIFRAPTTSDLPLAPSVKTWSSKPLTATKCGCCL